MSEDKSVKSVNENKNFSDGSDWIVALLIAILFGGYWSNPESEKINELEKKVARLEGKMSMVGGKFHE